MITQSTALSIALAKSTLQSNTKYTSWSKHKTCMGVGWGGGGFEKKTPVSKATGKFHTLTNMRRHRSHMHTHKMWTHEIYWYCNNWWLLEWGAYCGHTRYTDTATTGGYWNEVHIVDTLDILILQQLVVTGMRCIFRSGVWIRGDCSQSRDPGRRMTFGWSISFYTTRSSIYVHLQEAVGYNYDGV